MKFKTSYIEGKLEQQKAIPAQFLTILTKHSTFVVEEYQFQLIHAIYLRVSTALYYAVRNKYIR